VSGGDSPPKLLKLEIIAYLGTKIYCYGNSLITFFLQSMNNICNGIPCRCQAVPGTIQMKKEVLLGGNTRYGDARRFSNTSNIIYVLLTRLVANIRVKLDDFEQRDQNQCIAFPGPEWLRKSKTPLP